MSRYVLAPLAKRDLADIFDYVAAHSPRAALQLDDEFVDAFRRLADLPHMGRSQAHRRPNLRSWTVQKYLVFYEPTENGVEIARVLHGSRDLDSLF